MNPVMMLATTRRVLDQLRHDHRSVALILVVPALLLTAVYFLYQNETLPPGAPRTFDRVGLMMLAATRLRSWRVPALALATVHWGLHTLSHVIDPHHGAGDWVGWLEAGGLAFTTAILGIALREAIRYERGTA